MTTPNLASRLQGIVDTDVATYPEMPGRMLHVLAPSGAVEVAAGVRDRATGEPLDPGSRFRIASTTKSFVSAATLRLVEQGRLDLGALDTETPAFYERLGWRRWEGPFAVGTGRGVLSSPEQGGYLMVLLTPGSPADLDLWAPITCDWRPS